MFWNTLLIGSTIDLVTDLSLVSASPLVTDTVILLRIDPITDRLSAAVVEDVRALLAVRVAASSSVLIWKTSFWNTFNWNALKPT